jgi:lysophospholipase L1-like esterase
MPGPGVGPGIINESVTSSTTALATGSAFDYPFLHAALATVLDGTSDKKIGIIGDSITYGATANEGIGPCLELAKLLSAAGYPAALGMTVPPDPVNVGNDARWGLGPNTTVTIGSNGATITSLTTLNVFSTTGFAVSGNLFVQCSGGNGIALVAYTGTTATTFTGITYTSGGTGTVATGNYAGTNGWFQSTGTFAWGAENSMWFGAVNAPANGLTFTPGNGYSYDTFDIWYLQRTGAGTFQVNIDGGSNTGVPTGGSIAVKKATITGSASSSHVLQIGTVTVANVFIIGIEPSLSTAKRLRVANLGAFGSKTSDWVNETRTNNGPLDCIQTYNADVSIINLGVNDAGTGVSVTTYLANLLTIVNACRSTTYALVTTSASSGTYNLTITIGSTTYTTATFNYNDTNQTISSTLSNGTNGPAGVSCMSTTTANAPTAMTLVVPGTATVVADFTLLVGGSPTLTLSSNPTSDVIILSAVPSAASDGTYLANEIVYAAALPGFCVQYGCYFIDLLNAWGGANGYATLSAAGYYGAGSPYSLLHPSNLGQTDIARLQAHGITAA